MNYARAGFASPIHAILRNARRLTEYIHAARADESLRRGFKPAFASLSLQFIEVNGVLVHCSSELGASCTDTNELIAEIAPCWQ